MTADALDEPLKLEAEAWEKGQREATRIGKFWCDEFYDAAVASRALKMLELAA